MPLPASCVTIGAGAVATVGRRPACLIRSPRPRPLPPASCKRRRSPTNVEVTQASHRPATQASQAAGPREAACQSCLRAPAHLHLPRRRVRRRPFDLARGAVRLHPCFYTRCGGPARRRQPRVAVILTRYDELKQREEEERRAQSGQAAVAGLWNSMSGKNPTGRRLAQVLRHGLPCARHAHTSYRRHTHATHTPCTRHACTGHTCTRHAHATHTPCIYGAGAASRVARACCLARTAAATQSLLPGRRGRHGRGGARGTAAAVAAAPRPLVCTVRELRPSARRSVTHLGLPAITADMLQTLSSQVRPQ